MSTAPKTGAAAARETMRLAVAIADDAPTHPGASMSTPDTITQIPLEQLHESPFNPRRTFAGIDELAANIRAEGCIHEPLLVRPRILAQGLARRGDGRREDGDTQDGYEVVFGHRRLRAAAAARLATVPCMVRALTDAQARSAQISENLQRHDVHPIEEAEGLRALIDAGVLTAAEKPAPDSAAAREKKREAERKEAEQAASDESARRLALLQRVREAMQARPRDAFDLQIAAGAALAAVEWTDKQALAALLGVDVRELSAMAGGKWLARQDAATLSQLVMDCALIGECDAQPWNMDTPPALLLRVAAHYGVDTAPAQPAEHTPPATAETAEADAS